MKTLENRVAVVTGAASGIGLALVEAFVSERMRVVMADLNEAALSEQSSSLAAAGKQVLAVRTDVRDPEAVEALADATVEHYGRLDVAVNNAGIVNRGLTWELPLGEWRRVLDINLCGVIHGIRSFVPRILATSEEGHVVNTASMAAVMPIGRIGPYTAAKHAVLGISDVLRKDLDEIGAPVGVSVVMPGMIRTGMNPFGTVPPETVAKNVLAAMRERRAYVYTDDHFVAEAETHLRSIMSAREHVIGTDG